MRRKVRETPAAMKTVEAAGGCRVQRHGSASKFSSNVMAPTTSGHHADAFLFLNSKPEEDVPDTVEWAPKHISSHFSKLEEFYRSLIGGIFLKK